VRKDGIDGWKAGVDDANFDFKSSQDGAGRETVGEVFLVQRNGSHKTCNVDQAYTILNIRLLIAFPKPFRVLISLFYLHSSDSKYTHDFDFLLRLHL